VKDREPTKILANGAIRYGVYDDAGNFLRYEYIKLEDEPTEEGMPLCKATLLKDVTCEALDIPTTSVPNDAFFVLSIGNNRGLVVATVYETGTTTPIPNVVVSGILTATGGEVATNSSGVAIGYTATTTTTVSVHSEYADLTVAAQTISTPFSKKATVTLYATRKPNAETSITTSKYYRFTERVLVDVDVLGGGYNGSSSWGYSGSSESHAGNGGASGRHAYSLNLQPDPKQRYQAIVGGPNGGTTSFLGVNSGNGATTGNGGIGAGRYETAASSFYGTPGEASTAQKYGTGAIVGGGGGGGGHHYNRSGAAGGSPYGGSGCTSTDPATGNATGYGGGGGGAYGFGTEVNAGGFGYQGVIYFRWRYKS